MRKITVMALVVCAVVFASPSALFAAETNGEDAYGMHGLYMRLALGVGYGYSQSVQDSTDQELHVAGAGLNFDLQLGYCPWTNLAVFLDIHSLMIPAGGITFKSNGASTSDAPYDQFSLAYNQSLGLGALYYIYDFYGGFAVGYSMMYWSLMTGSDTESTEFAPTGVVVSLLAGKDWRVSDDWALGVGLRLDYYYNTSFDNSNNATYTTLDVLAQFVVTYN